MSGRAFVDTNVFAYARTMVRVNFPLLVFDGEGRLVSFRLRAGNAGNNKYATALMVRLVRKIKARFPRAMILVRADSGFCTTRMLDALDRLDQQLGDILYAIGITYPQDWPAYNAAQCEEKDRVQVLLKALCDGIAQPKQEGRGRRRLPLADVVFGATMKVYGTMSGRRSTSDLRACEAAGHVEQAPAYNSLFRYVEQPGMMPLLKTLVEESAAPLKAVERQFAADATGFASPTYVRWFDYKHGEDRRVQQWVKCHAMIGTATHVITAVEATGGHVNDSPMFASLVNTTAANGFDVQEVSADKAYLSHDNLATVEKVGGVPFVPFKSNSGSAGSEAWERMYHYFAFNRETFLSHYDRRSNVESAFSAMKRKFGENVRSKNLAAQLNEVLLKCLCHNLSMVVHAIHELNVEPEFWLPKAVGA